MPDTAYRCGREAIADVIARLLAAAEIEVEAREMVVAALHTYRTKSFNVADVLNAVLNRRDGCSSTATFDRKAAKLDGFTLVR